MSTLMWLLPLLLLAVGLGAFLGWLAWGSSRREIAASSHEILRQATSRRDRDVAERDETIAVLREELAAEIAETARLRRALGVELRLDPLLGTLEVAASDAGAAVSVFQDLEAEPQDVAPAVLTGAEAAPDRSLAPPAPRFGGLAGAPGSHGEDAAAGEPTKAPEPASSAEPTDAPEPVGVPPGAVEPADALVDLGATTSIDLTDTAVDPFPPLPGSAPDQLPTDTTAPDRPPPPPPPPGAAGTGGAASARKGGGGRGKQRSATSRPRSR